VITLGFGIAIGLPLAVLALAVALPERWDKHEPLGRRAGGAQPPAGDESDSM
jgi:hypothetical protein